MKQIDINDNNVLAEAENINSSIVGLAVDYLTRFVMGAPAERAFAFSLAGAKFAEIHGQKKAFKEANKYLKNIRGIDKKSIINACKIVTFDVWFRSRLWRWRLFNRRYIIGF